MTYVVQIVEEGLRCICHSGKKPNMTPQQAPMTYVVQKAEEEPRWAYHSGFEDIYDAQLCTYFVRSAESKRNANQKKSTAVSRAAKQGYAKPTGGIENTAGLRPSYENGAD